MPRKKLFPLTLPHHWFSSPSLVSQIPPWYHSKVSERVVMGSRLEGIFSTWTDIVEIVPSLCIWVLIEHSRVKPAGELSPRQIEPWISTHIWTITYRSTICSLQSTQIMGTFTLLKQHSWTFSCWFRSTNIIGPISSKFNFGIRSVKGKFLLSLYKYYPVWYCAQKYLWY